LVTFQLERALAVLEAELVVVEHRGEEPALLVEEPDAPEVTPQQLAELLSPVLADMEGVLDPVLRWVGGRDDQNPVLAEHAPELRERPIGVRHVLDGLEGHDEVEARVREGKFRHVGLAVVEPVLLTGVGDGLRRRVHPHDAARARGRGHRGAVALAAGRVEHVSTPKRAQR
jgi:hypothetical protein